MPSAKLQISVFSLSNTRSFEIILNNSVPCIDTCNIPKRILSQELKVESNLRLWNSFEW